MGARSVFMIRQSSCQKFRPDESPSFDDSDQCLVLNALIAVQAIAYAENRRQVRYTHARPMPAVLAMRASTREFVLAASLGNFSYCAKSWRPARPRKSTFRMSASKQVDPFQVRSAGSGRNRVPAVSSATRRIVHGASSDIQEMSVACRDIPDVRTPCGRLAQFRVRLDRYSLPDGPTSQGPRRGALCRHA
ncbi:hypothetical protein ACVWWK_002597 [Bradyrhizobium sp. LB9.1b]